MNGDRRIATKLTFGRPQRTATPAHGAVIWLFQVDHCPETVLLSFCKAVKVRSVVCWECVKDVMKHSRVRALWLLGSAITLAACSFDGEVLREYLPSEVSKAPSIYNKRDILVCALSIYQLPGSAQHMDVPLSKPDHSSSDWFQLPLAGKVEYASFATQALFDGNECFDLEAQRITGLRQLSEYYSADQQGYFIELRDSLILVHDIVRNMIIISSRAR